MKYLLYIDIKKHLKKLLKSLEWSVEVRGSRGRAPAPRTCFVSLELDQESHPRTRIHYRYTTDQTCARVHDDGCQKIINNKQVSFSCPRRGSFPKMLL